MTGHWKQIGPRKKTLKETIQEHDESYRSLIKIRPVLQLTPREPEKKKPTVNEILNILNRFKLFMHL